MDLLYFGSGAFGLPTLQALAGHHTIRGVVTQPDRPAGRGGRLTPTPIAQWAEANLPEAKIIRREDVNTPEVLGEVRGVAADAWVVIAFGQKLSPGLLERRFAINLHGSILPRWRGAAPINAAILAGDAHAGNSVITLAERMDAGLILAQSMRDLPPSMTAGELHDLLASDGPDVVQSVLAAFEGGMLTPRSQDETLATRATKLSRAVAWVDFGEQAEQCRRRIHGLTPWPGVTVQLKSDAKVQLKLCRVQVEALPTEEEAGTIVDPEAGMVACGGGTVLRILEIHPAGKRRMTWADFQHGHRLNAGEKLSSAVAPPSSSSP